MSRVASDRGGNGRFARCTFDPRLRAARIT
jgi:hypothetical protein